MKKPWLLLQIAILFVPVAACGRRPLQTEEIERNGIFAEIMKREDHRSLGEDGFFRAQLGDDSQPQVQEWCAIALGRIGNARALPWLYETFHSRYSTVRAAAAFAVGEIEDGDLLRSEGLPVDVRAAGELRTLLDDSAIAVRMRAVEALGKTGQDADAFEIIRRLENFAYDRSPEERAYLGFAVTALMRLRNPAARPVLERLASFDDPEIQWRVANAFYRMRIKEARPTLERLLGSSNSDVRAHAARALGICADPDLADMLAPMLAPIDSHSGRSNPLSVRVSALQALSNLKNPGSVAAIKEALATAPIGVSDAERLDQLNFTVQAATVLGNLGSKDAVATLANLARIPGPVADSAVVALARLLHDEPEEFLDLIHLGAYFGTAEGARAWTAALGELGGASANGLLRGLLAKASQNPTGDAATLMIPSILQALARAQAPGLQELLKNYFTSTDGVLMRAAAAAYKPEAGAPQPWKPLLQAYAQIDSTLDEETKVALIGRLEPWKGAGEVQLFLRAALQDRARNARIAAARLLRQAGMTDVPDDPGPSVASTTDFTYILLATARRDRTIAIMETTRGTIEMELFREDAPMTVANFVTLSNSGFFNGLTFMRVVPYFVIQGGDPRNDQEGGPGYTIRCEINMHPFERGSVGMALSGKDTGGSQFFICLSSQPHLDGGYTCFGRVISGMQAAEHMVAGDRILKVQIKDEVAWIDYRRY
ncbi:MAG: peptidylprolyl isomerase [Acidobacteriota bacterium]|jgi:cyclophilin family peptidyl-prolyl cis-trans isomerase/HEAT repeat protein